MIDGQSIVHEATVSIPLTDLQTRFIAGQIPDWSGYEYLPPTLNKLITHNLLFDFTLPTAYTGVGLEITSGKWIDQGHAGQHERERANARATRRRCWSSASTTRGRIPGLRLRRRARQDGQLPRRRTSTVARTRRRSRHSTARHAVDLFEVDGYFIRGDWTLHGQVSYGQQKKAAITADPTTGELRDAAWCGPVGAGGLQVHAALRGRRCAPTTSTTRRTAAACSATPSPTTVNGIGPDAARRADAGVADGATRAPTATRCRSA